MLPKYIPLIFIFIGSIALATATDAPCDNQPYAGGQDCWDHKGKYIYEYDMCLENDDIPEEGVKGVMCIKPGHAFSSRVECEEKCKDAIAAADELGVPEDK